MLQHHSEYRRLRHKAVNPVLYPAELLAAEDFAVEPGTVKVINIAYGIIDYLLFIAE